MIADYFKGRGSQINPSNQFLKAELVTEHPEGLDEELNDRKPRTQIYYESPRKVVNKVDSPDLALMYSVNPYQGCEHGCAYCYARNTHEYWGFSAGMDFETKIIVKKEAAFLLEKHLLKRSWRGSPIMISGNTDCYQPLERKFKITRSLLKVLHKYGNPVGLITKNILITRDMDILKELAREGLVHVFFSITTLDEALRRILEPRTATASGKLKAMEQLSKAGIPVGLMNAPIIPGINDHEITEVVRQAADHGALGGGYTVVRLNGAIGHIFYDWLRKNFPDRAKKVWRKIASLHGGKVNDTEWFRRIKGEGELAQMIGKIFDAAKNKYFPQNGFPEFNMSRFRKNGSLRLSF